MSAGKQKTKHVVMPKPSHNKDGTWVGVFKNGDGKAHRLRGKRWLGLGGRRVCYKSALHFPTPAAVREEAKQHNYQAGE